MRTVGYISRIMDYKACPRRDILDLVEMEQHIRAESLGAKQKRSELEERRGVEWRGRDLNKEMEI
jgi:hypothetical protein